MNISRDELNNALSCFGGLGPHSGIQLAIVSNKRILRTTKIDLIEQIKEKVKDFKIEVHAVIRCE